MRSTLLATIFVSLVCWRSLWAQDSANRIAPSVQEQQLPLAMHSKMELRPHITVGQRDAEIIGNNNRALQAAVEYVSALGGGTVEIGPGEYMMHDSLHLRSQVTVRGTPRKTILRKAKGNAAPLVLDGDFGEQQATVTDAAGFEVGCGVAIWDKNAGGFHTTVARITGRTGNTFSIDKPLMADCMVADKAQAATVFPIVSGYDVTGARVEDLIIEGNSANNLLLNGCRGAGIFLYRGYGTSIARCSVRDFNGDGISFQQSNDVTVTDCLSEGNTQLGLHPGSGSQRPAVHDCVARGNGTDGLFLCWRVRHGLFTGNLLENNGRFGISIGHKDSDNLLQRNRVLKNGGDGVHFRNESFGMAAHRNRLIDNIIEDNGSKASAAGIRVRGETTGLIFQKNVIRDTRQGAARSQTTGILIEESAGEISLSENQVDAQQPVTDRRR